MEAMVKPTSIKALTAASQVILAKFKFGDFVTIRQIQFFAKICCYAVYGQEELKFHGQRTPAKSNAKTSCLTISMVFGLQQLTLNCHTTCSQQELEATQITHACKNDSFICSLLTRRFDINKGSSKRIHEFTYRHGHGQLAVYCGIIIM